MNSTQLREGIFALHTRRFGTVAEIMIQRMKKLGPARARFHDLFDEIENKQVEVKFSRSLAAHDGPITTENVLQVIAAAPLERKAVAIADAAKDVYDCNIQQVKRSSFDVLYYGIFFKDAVVVFRSESNEIPNTPGYSDKQHKGNQGEGQFHISSKTYDWHRKNRLYAELTYDELLGLLVSK